MEKNPFLYRDKSRERYVAVGEKQSKAYKIIAKNLKKEYSETLRNLGDKAPKSYSEFLSLEHSKKEDLRHYGKTISYILSSSKE